MNNDHNTPDPMEEPLPERPRDPSESFVSSSEPAQGTLADFWTWGYSQLLDNAQRGVLAEYIVGLALGCTKDRVRANWEAYDLMYRDRYGIEVKSSAYLQAWKQNTFSPIDFSIGEHLMWDSSLGWVGLEKSRPAAIYVFCVFTENPEHGRIHSTSTSGIFTSFPQRDSPLPSETRNGFASPRS